MVKLNSRYADVYRQIMRITDCRFRASHKHWAGRVDHISMIVSGTAIVFVNDTHVVIHTQRYGNNLGYCSYSFKHTGSGGSFQLIKIIGFMVTHP